MGFSGQVHWNGLPCPSPGDLPNPRIEPMSPALQADSLPLKHWGSPFKEIKIKVKLGHISGPSSNMTCVLIRGAGPSRMGTHTRKSHMRTQQETVICKPRREASGETQPADTLSWTSSLQNYEQVSFCCLSHPAYGVLLYSSLAD